VLRSNVDLQNVEKIDKVDIYDPILTTPPPPEEVRYPPQVLVGTQVSYVSLG
jgi:hypothetical protein